MKKFITLRVSHLRLDDIGGLVSETIALITPQTAVIGVVAAAKFQTLASMNTTLHELMNKQRASALTPQIKEKDAQRDALFAEIKRTSKSGQKSSLPDVAAAGTMMVDFLKPFWNIGTEPIMSQTDQINLLSVRYAADPALAMAATTLGIAPQMQWFFNYNADLFNLYNTRLDEMSDVEGPSASSIKNEVVKEYDEFCVSLETVLSALPTDALQKLFDEINEIRRKYISRLPTPLDEKHTSVAPITEQRYTGRHITPLPRVFFQAGDELRELIFAQDFTVTYRNNVNVGEAKLFIHGKGKYTGSYDTTFHIVNEQ
ncbi:MAG: DUF6261 family protein [Prevotellaceae bacterium]|jgi:hypothetical protein|nr:DUF6261 family protein [Prevotellaceae bacterium]